jgi:hypothetical protein
MNKLNSFRRWFAGIAFGATVMGVGLSAQPSWSAEKVTAKYGPFYRSIPVSDLQQYAETGKTTPLLDSFLRLVDAKERDKMRNGLNLKLPFNVVTVDKLFKSPMADQLLTQVADATILPGDVEKVALRGAIITAAASKEGLGTMSILKSYPTPTLTVDMKKMLKIMEATKGGIPGLGGMGGMMPSGGGTGAPGTPPEMPPK